MEARKESFRDYLLQKVREIYAIETAGDRTFTEQQRKLRAVATAWNEVFGTERKTTAQMLSAFLDLFDGNPEKVAHCFLMSAGTYAETNTDKALLAKLQSLEKKIKGDIPVRPLPKLR